MKFLILGRNPYLHDDPSNGLFVGPHIKENLRIRHSLLKSGKEFERKIYIFIKKVEKLRRGYTKVIYKVGKGDVRTSILLEWQRK